MVTLLVFALAAVIQDAPAPSPSPFTYDGAPPVDEAVREDVDEVGRLAKPKMLDLSAYSLYAERRVPLSPDQFHFDTTIEVVGRDPNDTMKDWWRSWNFEYSIYGRGINIQKPMPGGGFNILPLIDWLRDKAKERDRNQPPPEE